MFHDVEEYILKCDICQKNKFTCPYIKALFQETDTQYQPWDINSPQGAVTGNSIQRKHNISNQGPSHQDVKNRATECAVILLRIFTHLTKISDVI